MGKRSVRYFTKYPKIFTCYWGSAILDKDDIKDEIIENRNKFVEEFKISRLKTCPAGLDKYLGEYGFFTHRSINKYYDHRECYYTKDNSYVLVMSPYICGDDMSEFFKMRGYKPYNKLYRDDAETFIRVVKYNKLWRKYYVDNEYKIETI